MSSKSQSPTPDPRSARSRVDHPLYARELSKSFERLSRDTEGRQALKARLGKEHGLRSHALEQRCALEISFLAHQGACEALAQSSSRKLSLNLWMGKQAYTEAFLRQLSHTSDPLSQAVGTALCQSFDQLPETGIAHLELGFRAEGLIFGSMRMEPLSGSFHIFERAAARHLRLAGIGLVAQKLAAVGYEITDTEHFEQASATLVPAYETLSTRLTFDDQASSRPIFWDLPELRQRLADADRIEMLTPQGPEPRTAAQARRLASALSAQAAAAEPLSAPTQRFMMSLGV